MRITYHTPAVLCKMLNDQHKVVDAHLAAADAAHKVAEGLYEALRESYERVQKGLPVGVTVIELACGKCEDTHKMTLGDREVPCTFCPVPCEKCRDGLSAYCKDAPCPCECHPKGKTK